MVSFMKHVACAKNNLQFCGGLHAKLSSKLSAVAWQLVENPGSHWSQTKIVWYVALRKTIVVFHIKPVTLMSMCPEWVKDEKKQVFEHKDNNLDLKLLCFLFWMKNIHKLKNLKMDLRNYKRNILLTMPVINSIYIILLKLVWHLLKKEKKQVVNSKTTNINLHNVTVWS